jgi:hypothetical protein
MLNSVNQIRVELEEIANAHLQINNFFWGDFLRAYKEDTELNYVLMGCFYPTASLLNNQTQLTLTIYICDRVYKDYSNLNDVESDTLQICRDVYNVINSSFRWKRLGRVQSASAQKFIERGGDEVAGHTLTIQFLLRDVSGICELPMQDYDFDQPAPVPGECDPAELLILDSEGGELYNLTLLSGTQSTQEISDATAVLKDTSGTVISTTSILAEGSEDIEAPDATYTVQYENGTPIESGSIVSAGSVLVEVPDPIVCEDVDLYVGEANVGSFPSGSDIFVKVIQDGLEVIPQDVTVVDDEVSIILEDSTPCPPVPIGATLMKTGQTISYASGDDGDIEAGREVSFTTLNVNNPFGNTNRFTDILGGQTYTLPIVIDWSTYNGFTVLGYRRTLSLSYTNWATANTSAQAVSIGAYTTGWRLPNRKEMENIMNMGVTGTIFNYAPFSITADRNVWTGTTNPIVTANAFLLASTGNGGISSVGKTIVAGDFIPCRIFTVTGTTLT